MELPLSDRTNRKPAFGDLFPKTLRLPIVKLRWDLGETGVYIAICSSTLTLAETKKRKYFSFFCERERQDANRNINTSFTEVSPRFHYAQAQCFGKHVSKRRFPIGTGRKPQFHQSFTEVSLWAGAVFSIPLWEHGPMWHPGAARGGGANEAYLSRCFAAPAPNFNVVDSGVWKFEIEQVIIEIGGVGGRVRPQSCLDSFTCAQLRLWMEARKGVWIQQGFGRLIRRPLQYGTSAANSWSGGLKTKCPGGL